MLRIIPDRHKSFLPLVIVAVFFIQSFASQSYGDQTVVGKIDFSRGTVAAAQTGQPARMLGKGESVFQGDNIQTGERSFAILVFKDGAKITIRPNSNFSIDQYNSTGETPSARLSLHKGGVKASSGSIGKKDPKQFQIKTAQAVVHASQADYSIRLCEDDCAQESKNLKPVKLETDQTVIGRSVKVAGFVTAQNKNKGKEEPRAISLGGAIYRSDLITTNSDGSVLLAFRDGGRVALEADTEFDISEYRYRVENSPDIANFKLVKGGLRALTGLIGKEDKTAYTINAPVATMGIRGTGFDLKCQGDCIGETAPAALLITGQEEGLYSFVWQGAISQTNTAGIFGLDVNSANYLANINSRPVEFPRIPQFFIETTLKRPDTAQIDMDELFGAEGKDDVPPGLYVAVDDGHVEIWPIEDGEVSDKPLYLGASEAAYVSGDGSIVIRLEAILNFLLLDPYPNPWSFEASDGDFAFSLLAGETTLTADSMYECRCD